VTIENLGSVNAITEYWQVRTRVHWPDGKQFAFTIFDDPDAQTVEAGKRVYGLLGDLGFRTTRGVWPGRAVRTPNSRGTSCEDPEYLRHTQALQAAGFEIGYHNHTKHSSTRQEIVAGLDGFREFFGQDPSAMANHYNADGDLLGTCTPDAADSSAVRRGHRRTHERQALRARSGTPVVLGDVCRERIQYCRNFVFTDINTLAAVPGCRTTTRQTVRPAVVRVNRRLERRAIPCRRCPKQSGPPCSRGRALHHVHALRARVCERPRFPCFPMPVQQMGLELTKITREKRHNDWKVASSGTPWSPVEARTNGASEKMLRPAEPPA